MAGSGSWRRVTARRQPNEHTLYPTTKLYPPLHCTFVLWGDQFDEIAAVIFVSALRQVGMKVKLVGLSGPTSVGINQLTVGVDLTLGDALTQAMPALCLIVPCSGGVLRRFENDPRLAQLLTQICRPQTQVIVKEPNTLAPTTLEQLSIPLDNLAIYSASDDLMGFAHYTVQSLAAER
jgi:hypothetical protein